MVQSVQQDTILRCTYCLAKAAKRTEDQAEGTLYRVS